MKDKNVLFSELRTKKHSKLVSVAGAKRGDSWFERKERKYVASASTIFFQMKDSGQAILLNRSENSVSVSNDTIHQVL